MSENYDDGDFEADVKHESHKRKRVGRERESRK